MNCATPLHGEHHRMVNTISTAGIISRRNSLACVGCLALVCCWVGCSEQSPAAQTGRGSQAQRRIDEDPLRRHLATSEGAAAGATAKSNLLASLALFESFEGRLRLEPVMTEAEFVGLDPATRELVLESIHTSDGMALLRPHLKLFMDSVRTPDSRESTRARRQLERFAQDNSADSVLLMYSALAQSLRAELEELEELESPP